MEPYVLGFNEIDKSYLSSVGGKGANLGEMTKAGFPIPQGFCVSTSAYRSFLQASSEMEGFYEELNQLHFDDLEQISRLAQQIRDHINSLTMPEEVKNAIVSASQATGRDKAYAVRSSATAEDLPSASFAGQQDTYLNVIGQEALLKAVQNCWASLYTDRAISYRAKNGFDHRSVFLSVVVQEMVFPEVSGILFTADPVSGHRHTISIDASYGLGEALVAGLVTADLYQVRSGQIIKKQISKKELAIYSLPQGGTITKPLPPESQEAQALSDSQILELAAIGQQIENHYGSEQDIEWAYANNKFFILQSRPITSLYPLPAVSDTDFHVYINFGYIQMMTAPMKPISISLISNVTNFLVPTPAANKRILREAGGRAFADFTKPLSLPPMRRRILKLMGGMDKAMATALLEATSHQEFQRVTVPKKVVARTVIRVAPHVVTVLAKAANNLLLKNPATANRQATAFINEKVAENKNILAMLSGAERVRFIRRSMRNMFPEILTKIVPYFIAGMLASGRLETKLKNKFGDVEAAELLSKLYKSLPGNVTTEMGIQLGDLADHARKSPQLIAYLQNADNPNFYEGLYNVPGGLEFKKELDRFLGEFGSRCAGEIDIAKPRWSEEPAQLVPSIMSNIQTASPGEHRNKFYQGELEAEETAQYILSHFGFIEKKWVFRLLKVYRNLMGMREHHKFALIQLMYLYKRAMLEDARFLVEKGVLAKTEDIFYLSLEEFIALLENGNAVLKEGTIEARKRKNLLDQKLRSPRILTSDGEMLNGRPVVEGGPEGAIIGSGVSAGVVEGIARVVLQPEDAKLNRGEILVAPFTDPGWTPLFTSAVGLVTEVGGMMTHGSVVAREYGIPAVVGVDNATELIKDGEWIRVDGTQGFVEKIEHP
ncbi:phosphoenolpyruvate synthase [Planococcus sp. N028]|uniref:Phosphoenolpyruvate synthase n=1 Tax=Planococcus shixiaomingii TaxID=3058393 RepID=A0ABT8N119_9BACL|nr:phosphoenolpyruvate synthase [Planococcus sp. N028]MDN7241554.1 phosphoenolpyruvate synthase [Planococcus sp. N028]